ncbi:hypothetical protein LAU42_08915 [Macrococcus armenti]|uniref:hypothetical protein n=1 Tax=Macrococcus armenti TaxID=2875764 RepID=UPI001CCDBF67|nr:hypothetical protein [Macrococcus armenti]UBH21887.1 hypothetical protein LAU42_08915 [Macrococcus armenti]
MKKLNTIKKAILTTVTTAVLFTGLTADVNAASKSKKVVKKPVYTYTYEGGAQAACQMYRVCNKNASIYTFKAVNAHLLQDLTYYDAQEKSRKRLVKGAYYHVIYIGDYPKKAVRINRTKQLDAKYKRIQAQQKRYKFRNYNGGYTF